MKLSYEFKKFCFKKIDTCQSAKCLIKGESYD